VVIKVGFWAMSTTPQTAGNTTAEKQIGLREIENYFPLRPNRFSPLRAEMSSISL
jgi:hypothetical protein